MQRVDCSPRDEEKSYLGPHRNIGQRKDERRCLIQRCCIKLTNERIGLSIEYFNHSSRHGAGDGHGTSSGRRGSGSTSATRPTAAARTQSKQECGAGNELTE